MKTFLTVTFIISAILSLQAQTQDISVSLTALDASGDETCFAIDIQNMGSEPYALAGQNYRLYYDASTARFLRHQLSTSLPSEAYSEMTVIQSSHDVNASGYGNLEFDKHLGFVNLAIYDSGYLPDLVSLESRVALEVATICFESLTTADEVSIVWARKGMTEGYATAYTEIQGYHTSRLFSWNLIYQDIISTNDQSEGLVVKE